MRSRPILLLDVDGVLLDIDRHDAEWARLADAVFEPLLGARAGGWAELQRATWLEVARRLGDSLWKQTAAERPTPASFFIELHAQWIAALCAAAALPAPDGAQARAELARRALDSYLRTTGAASPGARQAIVELSARFELHMASGNPACVVESVLHGLGVRELIGLPFGSDLACVFKEDSTAFYRAILARLGADAADVWVVDDRDTHLAEARALGARTIKVGATSADHDVVVNAIAELPAALAALR